MKKLLLALTAVIITAMGVYAAGDLARVPATVASYPGSPMAIQQYVPTAQGTVASLGTGGATVHQNVTVTSLTAIRAQGVNASTGAGVAIKYRIGGFTTGTETSYSQLPTTGDVIWVGPAVTTIGFQAYSTATTLNLQYTKQSP